MNPVPAIDMTKNRRWRALRAAAAIGIALLAALLLPLEGQAAEQRTFSAPEGAVEALIAALKANDEAALVALVGDKHKSLISTGDATYDSAKRAEAAALLGTFHALDDSVADRRVLMIGPQAWPFPIPLVREGKVWRFAAEQGAEEIFNRRIGENELNAIRVLRAYVAAQHEYASVDRDGDGVLQYAQKLASTPGKLDGLYWPADAGKGDEMSPFGPLIAESSAYLDKRQSGDPYRGYRFRILTRQGKSAPGGAYSYVINGRMVAGFAMVAYPAAYGESGVMTFVVNSAGRIFEKDLGKDTRAIGAQITTFDPGAGWKATTP